MLHVIPIKLSTNGWLFLVAEIINEGIGKFWKSNLGENTPPPPQPTPHITHPAVTHTSYPRVFHGSPVPVARQPWAALICTVEGAGDAGCLWSVAAGASAPELHFPQQHTLFTQLTAHHAGGRFTLSLFFTLFLSAS